MRNTRHQPGAHPDCEEYLTLACIVACNSVPIGSSMYSDSPSLVWPVLRQHADAWNHVESLIFVGTNMNGYQITFFTLQDRRHHGKLIGEWLIHLAKELGLRGATLIQASESFGHHGRIHSAHFFELTDQPLEVVMAVSSEEAERLFARLKLEGVQYFLRQVASRIRLAGRAGRMTERSRIPQFRIQCKELRFAPTYLRGSDI